MHNKFFVSKKLYIKVIVSALFLFLFVHFAGINITRGNIRRHAKGLQRLVKLAFNNQETIKNQALTSILKRNKDVFAVDKQGLYRAQLADKTWKKLNTPEFMPLGGYYARQPTDSKIIFYYKSNDVFDPTSPDKILGLYRSSDDGQTWKLISESDGYEDVLLHPSGDLYAIKIVTSEDNYKGRRHVFVSGDSGDNWRDITNDVRADPRVLFVDPDRSNLVCLYADTNLSDSEMGNELYIMQSNDKKYIWRRTYNDEQWQKRTRENFFNSFVAPGGNVIYDLPATLQNFFKYNFESVPSLFSFTVISEKPQYEFRRGQQKTIKASIIYRAEEMKWRTPQEQPPDEVKLPDQKNQQMLWGVKIENPAGRRFFIKNTLSEPESSSLNQIELQARRSKYEIQTHIINQTQPYSRDIDLNKLSDFATLGTYKIQLIYNNKSVASEAIGEWNGAFNGEVITVVIKS